jgi:DMSO/TMAO reductase YedYZ molybdopterin-dependent catalytic subunit
MEDYEDRYWKVRKYHERGSVSEEERFKDHKRK